MGQAFTVHYFTYEKGIQKYLIWGLTDRILIHVASVVYQRPPDFTERRAHFKLPKLTKDCSSMLAGPAKHQCLRCSQLQHMLLKKKPTAYAIQSTGCKDGNGSGSDRVESPCTQNRNPKSKPESAPKTDSGGNPSPKPNPRIPETRTDTRNPNGYPKPEWIPETRGYIYTYSHV